MALIFSIVKNIEIITVKYLFLKLNVMRKLVFFVLLAISSGYSMKAYAALPKGLLSIKKITITVKPSDVPFGETPLTKVYWQFLFDQNIFRDVVNVLGSKWVSAGTERVTIITGGEILSNFNKEMKYHYKVSPNAFYSGSINSGLLVKSTGFLVDFEYNGSFDTIYIGSIGYSFSSSDITVVNINE